MTDAKSTTKKSSQKSTKSISTDGKKTKVFSSEEKAAMRARAKELKAEAEQADLETEVQVKIDEMQEPDRSMSKRIHTIIKESAPSLTPKLWYGMPAYAKDGKIVCFFQPAQKFKTRYSTFGFNDTANLDEGNLWPVAYALTKLTATEEAKIKALVKKAVS
jgi:uncharacterized protein YdhG (YjbR/CyaY superfamily)